MKKLGIIGGGVILSAALLVSSAGAVLASGSEAAPNIAAAVQEGQDYQGIFGTVSEIQGNNITLDSKSLGEVEVLLGSETIYKVPGQGDVSVEDIVKDIRLAILATPEDEEGVYTADRIMLVPDGSTYRHMNGVVVAIQERTMTIINAAGTELTVDLPEGVQGAEIGEFVSVAVQNRSGEGNYVASGLQCAAEVQTRMQAHLSELAGQGSGGQAQLQNREQVMEQLGEQCEELAVRHMEVLNNALGEAPESAQGAIQAAIQKTQQMLEQVRNTIQGLNAGTGAQNSN